MPGVDAGPDIGPDMGPDTRQGNGYFYPTMIVSPPDSLETLCCKAMIDYLTADANVASWFGFPTKRILRWDREKPNLVGQPPRLICTSAGSIYQTLDTFAGDAAHAQKTTCICLILILYVAVNTNASDIDAEWDRAKDLVTNLVCPLREKALLSMDSPFALWQENEFPEKTTEYQYGDNFIRAAFRIDLDVTRY